MEQTTIEIIDGPFEGKTTTSKELGKFETTEGHYRLSGLNSTGCQYETLHPGRTVAVWVPND